MWDMLLSIDWLIAPLPIWLILQWPFYFSGIQEHPWYRMIPTRSESQQALDACCWFIASFHYSTSTCNDFRFLSIQLWDIPEDFTLALILASMSLFRMPRFLSLLALVDALWASISAAVLGSLCSGLPHIMQFIITTPYLWPVQSHKISPSVVIRLQLCSSIIAPIATRKSDCWSSSDPTWSYASVMQSSQNVIIITTPIASRMSLALRIPVPFHRHDRCLPYRHNRHNMRTLYLVSNRLRYLFGCFGCILYT